MLYFTAIQQLQTKNHYVDSDDPNRISITYRCFFLKNEMNFFFLFLMAVVATSLNSLKVFGVL